MTSDIPISGKQQLIKMQLMITVKTNINLIATDIQEKLNRLRDKEYLLRPLAFDVISLMTERIHKEGKAADGSQIGTYSNEYMKLRTGNYVNADRFVKGANKGKNKNSGTFTDKTIRLNKNTGVFSGDEKAGTSRPNYNRSSDTKVIVSLTRQLENDWAVIATDRGYGIGFLNSLNMQKAGWVEENKKSDIPTNGGRRRIC